MESAIETTKTIFPISQFLDWQRHGTLNLSPIFQRRPVWKKPAKSLLIDSVVRGYTIPIILLRQVQDLKNLSMKMEVVDGQQRLRTLLAYIDPDCLTDFNDNADTVSVLRSHNSELASKPFSRLPNETKEALLNYQMSTHIFPNTTGDELIFRLFARLNSTGLSLKPQEIRNAEFHGAFKTLVYDLAFENFDKWRRWNIFSNDAISRMDEAEAVSECLIAMTQGVTAKRQGNISKFYRDYEDNLPGATTIQRRFTRVMSEIDNAVGGMLADSAFRRPALFFSLFSVIYHHAYGLRAPLELDRLEPLPLPRDFADLFLHTSRAIKSKDLPDHIQDAMDKATADKARRDQRHEFLMEVLQLEPAR